MASSAQTYDAEHIAQGDAGNREAARARRSASMVYRVKLVLYSYNGIVWPLVAPDLPGDAVFWTLWIGLHGLWPHINYAIVRWRDYSPQVEGMLIVAEAAMIGCAVNELDYLVWYVFAAGAASFISATAFGGLRLTGATALTFAGGALAWGLLRGFEFAGTPPLAAELVGAVGGALPLLLTTHANFRSFHRVNRTRHLIETRNGQYQAMMEMSATLRNTSDTDTLIASALADFAQLMPECGFGVVLREPKRPGVVRHAAFEGVDNDRAARIVNWLTGSTEIAGISAPLDVTIEGEQTRVLPLAPHLQQLEGFMLIRNAPDDRELTTMLRLFAEQIASALESNLLTQRLDHLANTDRLTGLRNRTYFERQIKYAARNQAGPAATDYSVIVIDLNGLKALNDTHGHEAGDAMIRLAGDKLSTAMRACDVLARFGGDEFVILANDCDSSHVQELVRRLATTVHDRQVETSVGDGKRIVMRISCSIGAASSDEIANTAGLVALADQRMYEDKQRFYAGNG